MAGETGEAVSNIGVKLTLDASGFMGGMKAAQGSLNTFQEQATKAGSGAAQLKAGGGKQVASGPSSAQNLTGVNVSLTINKSQLAQLRREIQTGLGTIPISITPVLTKAVRAEAQSVMAAVATPAIGTRSGAAHAIATAVKQNLPGKAHGGPVQQGRPVIVGERRPEVFVPQSHGRIESSVEKFYREQERLRRKEAELAALEFQRERQHRQRMAGGPVPAWRGATARAWQQTLAQGGGTFPVDPRVPVPSRGHAVGISAYLPGAQSYHVQRDDPVAFMRAFHAQKRAGAPYVGTWFDRDTGLIDVDPSTVISRARSADMVMRGGHEKAAYDLGRGREWTASNKGLRAQTSRLMDLVYGRRKAGGGLVEARLTQQQRQYTRNLRAAARDLSPTMKYWGKMWYPSARKIIASMADEFNKPEPVVRGMFAALSAGTEWGANKTKVRRILENEKAGNPFLYSLDLHSHVAAKRILEGEDPISVLGHTPKTYPFFRNLGGDLDVATVDRWALRTPTLGALSQVGAGPVRRSITKAYRRVAKEQGFKHVADFQAALWLAEKAKQQRALGRRFDFSKMASGGVAVAGQPHGLVHPGGGFVSQIMQTAADWANDPFMAIMSWQSLQQQKNKRKGGPVHASGGIGSAEGYFYRPSSAPDIDPWIPNPAERRFLTQLGNEPTYERVLTFDPKQRGWPTSYLEGDEGQVSFGQIPDRLRTGESAFPGRGLEQTRFWDPSGLETLGGTFHMARLRAGRLAGNPNMGQPGYMDSTGTIVAHNHPGGKWSWASRHSMADLRSFASEPERESWVVTARDLKTVLRKDPAFGGNPGPFSVSSAYMDSMREAFKATSGSGREAMNRYHEYVSKPDSVKFLSDFELWDRIFSGVAEESGYQYERLGPGQWPGGVTTPTGKRKAVGRGVQRPMFFEQDFASMSMPMTDRSERFRQRLLAENGIDILKLKGRAEGGPAWKRLLSGSYLTMRRAGRNAAKYYNKRYRGFRDLDLDYGGWGIEAVDWLTQSAGNEYWSEMDRTVSPTRRTSNIEEALGALDQPGRISETERRNALWGKTSRGGAGMVQRSHMQRLEQIRDNPVIPHYLKRWIEPLLNRSIASEWVGRQERRFEGDWPSIERSLSFLPEKRAFPVGTRPWGWSDESMRGRPKDQDMLPGWSRDWDRVRDLVGDRTGKSYYGSSNYGWDKLTGKDFYDPTKFTEPGYRTLQAMLRGRNNATGGNVGNGLYIVGEIGKELFVPNRLAHMIPDKVMQQIPKRADGGIVEIGRKRNELFAPPEDGIIIPNRLIDQIPHAQRGIRPGGGEIDPMWWDPKSFEERLVANLTTPQLRSYPSTASPAYGVNPGYQPSQMSAQTVTATTVNVTASGSTNINARNTAATAAGAAGSAAARRLPPGYRDVGGVAVPPSATEGDVRDLQRLMAPGYKGAPGASPEAAAELRGYKTTEQASAGYEEMIAKTIRTAPGTRRLRYNRLSDDLAVQMAGMGQTMPSRTPRGAIASIGSFLFGGVQQMTQAQKERAQAQIKSDRASARAERVTSKAADAHERLNKQLKDGEIDITTYYDEISDLHASVRRVRGEAREAGKNLIEATKKTLPTTGGVLRNLGVIIGATTAYGMAMQMAATVLNEAAIPAVGKMVDELTGWVPTYTRVSTAMAEQTRQQGGNYKAAVASAAATAGLSYETTVWAEQSLKASTTAKAGAKAFTEAKDLIAGSMGAEVKPETGMPIDFAENVTKALTLGLTDAGFLLDRFRSGPAGSPQGLYGGYGGVGGTALFAEQMGGGPGLQQQITDLLRSGMKPGPATGVAGTAQSLFTAAGSIFGPIGSLAANQISGAVLAPLAGTQPGAGAEHLVGSMRESMERAAQRGGTPAYGVARRAGEAGKLEALGADQTIVDMAKLGYVYTDSMDNTITSLKELDKAVLQLAEGMTIPDTKVWATTIERQITAEFGAIDIKGAFNRDVMIPLQAAVQRIQQPYLAPGTGMIPGVSGMAPGQISSFLGRSTAAGGLGLSGGTTSFISQSLANARALQKTQMDANRAAIKKAAAEIAAQPMTRAMPPVPVGSEGKAAPQGTPMPGFPGLSAPTYAAIPGPQTAGMGSSTGEAAAKEYTRLMTAAQTASARIADLQKTVADLSAEAGRASWANTIRLSLRSIKVAADTLAGASGKTGHTLGLLEGRMYRISRQSQALGLELQQRQITTQLALAQFQAPGETGEERYFRQKERIAEAGIAQRQLGYSKETYALSGEAKQIEMKYALQDAQAAHDVAVKMFEAQSAAAGSADEIAALQAQMAKDIETASSIQADATAKLDTTIGAMKSYVNTFGGTIDQASTKVATLGTYLGASAKGVESFLKALGFNFSTRNGMTTVTSPTIDGVGGVRTTVRSGGTSRRSGVDGGLIGGATGILGMTGGTTGMVVGEAGTEAVAILRNPRAASVAPSGGYSGPANVSINISGVTVRSEQDISSLARQVAAEVERSLSRKGQMFGLRGPAV